MGEFSTADLDFFSWSSSTIRTNARMIFFINEGEESSGACDFQEEEEESEDGEEEVLGEKEEGMTKENRRGKSFEGVADASSISGVAIPLLRREFDRELVLLILLLLRGLLPALEVKKRAIDSVPSFPFSASLPCSSVKWLSVFWDMFWNRFFQLPNAENGLI